MWLTETGGKRWSKCFFGEAVQDSGFYLTFDLACPRLE